MVLSPGRFSHHDSRFPHPPRSLVPRGSLSRQQHFFARAMISLERLMKSPLLLVAVVPGWPSRLARGTTAAVHHGWPLQPLLPFSLLLTLTQTTTTASSVGVRGGFGERQPGLEYDTGDPLFDLNVLVTGKVCRGFSVRSLDVHVPPDLGRLCNNKQ